MNLTEENIIVENSDKNLKIENLIFIDSQSQNLLEQDNLNDRILENSSTQIKLLDQILENFSILDKLFDNQKKNMLKWTKQSDKTDVFKSKEDLNIKNLYDSVDKINNNPKITIPAYKKIRLEQEQIKQKILKLNNKQKKYELKDNKIEIKMSQLSNKQKELRNQLENFELEQTKLIKKIYILRYNYDIMNQLYYLNMIYEKASILLISWH